MKQRERPSRRPLAALALTAWVAQAAAVAGQIAPPAAPAAGGEVAGLLSQHGVRAIEPAAPATDFTLPNLAGGETSLSDYYGSWVVLTFFATWCGPCRSELPTLERLHRERAERGVVVLGVSVDDDRSPLDPFVRQLGLSFPILWDHDKRVGAAYRASSIPTSYLVDPRGRLVGVSRGARDWSALSPMLDAALAAVPATLTVDPTARPVDAYADAGEEVATPSITDPPSAELALSTERPEAGDLFYLDIRLRWAGNFDEYLPHPPQVQLPEGVVQESVTAESSSREGRNRLTYRVALRAGEPGRYALDPVELRYTPRGEATPLAARVAGPTVEVVAPTVLGLPPGLLGVGAASVALLGLAGWGVSRRLKRRRAEAGPRSGASRYDELRGRFEEARKKRLQGDGAGYLLALAELDRELDGEAAAEPDPAMREAVERARYGGEVPPMEELDQLQRKVERRLEELRPDPEEAARREVRLRDDGDS